MSPGPDVPVDAREREELCDLLLAEGPDEPTLCTGWTTLDLAAHLVLREHDVRAPLAILGGERFAGLEDKVRRRRAEAGLPALVETLRAGPPLVPWRLPVLRESLNLVEWFVHHEDVRRAGPDPAEPRTDRPDLDAALWGQLRRSARLLARRLKGAGLTLVAPGHGEVTARRARSGQPVVTLTGSPQELVLFLFGRTDVARVERAGPPEGLALLDLAHLGL
jgi:uncharacterized protein (TIGR03085 family)